MSNLSSSPPITDVYMREMLSKTRPYSVIIIHKTSKFGQPGTDKIIMEHGRRNFELRRDGKLSVVCAINDGTDVSGVGVFATSVEETRRIYEEDPGVKAGIFSFEVHPTRSFPGDTLPK